jgi:hypothetical protein
MKPLLIALVGVVLVGCGPRKDSRGFYVSDARVCLSTWTFITSGTTTWSAPVTSSYSFYDQQMRLVLKIDSDGDIFLRGKWIGWDGGLSQKYREGKALSQEKVGR